MSPSGGEQLELRYYTLMVAQRQAPERAQEAALMPSYPAVMTDAEREMAEQLQAAFEAGTVSLMDDIDLDERREDNRRVMNELREQFGLPTRNT